MMGIDTTPRDRPFHMAAQGLSLLKKGISLDPVLLGWFIHGRFILSADNFLASDNSLTADKDFTTDINLPRLFTFSCTVDVSPRRLANKCSKAVPLLAVSCRR
jgi:hypothetical protein